MRFQYDVQIQQGLQAYEESTENAVSLQKKLLKSILEKNCQTEIGRELGFSAVKDGTDYRDKVPLTDYGFYMDRIRRTIQGEENLLTQDPPVYHCLSSGSTDAPKYLPLTEEDLRLSFLYSYWAVFGIIARSHPGPFRQVLTPILQAGEFINTKTERGILSGVRSSASYQWNYDRGQFDCSAYCLPEEVLFPEKLEDLTYVRVRFALAEPDLRSVFGVFIHRLIGMLDYILIHWDMLLQDMASGQVSPEANISPQWQKYLMTHLPPNPERARELGLLDSSRLSENLVEKLWPKMQVLICAGGSIFAPYMQKLRLYAPNIQYYPYAYAATEGLFGIPPDVDRLDEYVLLPEMSYYEFLPENQDGGKTLTVEEVSLGSRYELVITNHSGLYRYCMQDVIQVVGFQGESPIIKFCYRKNQVLNVADERTNLAQLEEAVQDYCRVTGKSNVCNYCLFGDFSQYPPHYCICMEAEKAAPAAPDPIMDQCLSRANYGYGGCRKMGEIGEAWVMHVPRECFTECENQISREANGLGQVKPMRILTRKKNQDIFKIYAGENK